MQFLILLVGYIALLASASISLTDIQPITLFSTSCTGAYDTSIQNCDSARFAPLSSFSVCTQDCYNELNSLATKIQRACQDQGVKPDTVMAHAFKGDLGDWLCGSGAYATSPAVLATGTATNAKATTSSSASSASSTASITSSSSSNSTTSSSTSSSNAQPQSTSTLTSSASLTSTSTLSPSSTSSTGSIPRPGSGIGDSTPFDQVVTQNKGSSPKEGNLFFILKIVVPIIVSLTLFGIGGWIY